MSKDFVAVFDNTGATGRPLAITYLEDEGLNIASMPNSYTSTVNGKPGYWGTIIPNNNPNGVRAISRYRLSDGTLYTTNTDADGNWPPGGADPAANTVNPTGGATTPLIIPAASAPLPVTYYDLRTKSNAEAKTVLVSWATAAETGNDFFEIQRSADALTYTALGRVKGTGTTTARQEYRFLDEAPAPGWNYYRLRQVDLDGTESLSRAVAVLSETGLDAALTVFPNPAQGVVSLRLPAGQLIWQVSVVGLNGQRQQMPVANSNQIDVGTLPAALYLLDVQTTTGQLLRQRLLKQ